MSSLVVRRSPLGVLVLLCAASAGAQSGPAILRARPIPPPSPGITLIDLNRQSVFDSSEATGWVTRLANRLHVRTRSSVVRSELLFRTGERYDSGLAAESARNLRRLGIFREVTIDSVRTDSGLVARVVTKDGWTTGIDPTIQSSGSQVAWSMEFLETNFLGTSSRVLAKYVHDIDRNASQFEFTRPRLFAHTIGTELYYEDRSDGHQYIIGLSKPFTSLSSSNGADIFYQDFGGRLFRFTGGSSLASDTVERRIAIGRVHAAFAWRADNRGYIRLGMTAQVRRDNSAPESSLSLMGHTVTAALGPSLEWRHGRYVVARSVEHLGAPEDVDLSTRVRLDLLAAPRMLGYSHNGIGPSASVRLATTLPAGFGFLEARAGGILSSAGLDSGTALIAGTAILRPGNARQRILLHAEVNWATGIPIGSEFDLGFGYGPRGFRAHAFTGDRAWFTTAEYRYTLFPELAKLAGLGVAAFADHGGAWFAGQRQRNGTDVGLGLRLGPTRQADLRSSRIDFAYRFANDVEPAGWVIVVGKGFTFRTAQ